MAPEPPAVCGIRSCCGAVERIGTFLRCNSSAHHRGYLTRDGHGAISWKWATRGAQELTKKGLIVLNQDPDAAQVVGDAGQQGGGEQHGPAEQGAQNPNPTTPERAQDAGDVAMKFCV